MYVYIINSLKYFPKTLSNDSLLITNNHEVASYALKNNIEFKEFRDIISFEQCSKVNVHDYFKRWSKDKGAYQEYFESLKYSLGNQIKAIELAKTFSEALCLSYDFDKVFLAHSLTPSFKREMINNFQTKLISFFLLLNNKDVINTRKSYWIEDVIRTLLFKTLPVFTVLLFVLELLLKYFKRGLLKTTKVGNINFDILTFSAGTDTVYLSNISGKVSSHSTLNIQCDSNHGFKSQNFKNSMPIETFYFRSIFNMKQPIKTNRSDLIGLLSANNPNVEAFFLENMYLINYIYFRILREGLQVNMFKSIIKSVSPNVVVSSSLYLPVISANALNINTVSVIEGLGIGENPISPHPGRYVFSPNKFGEDQIKNQYSNKSYYTIGHELFQEKIT